ncbi:MAG: hypothetical protein AB8G99_22275 [Planctomycetaceae bacterium]
MCKRILKHPPSIPSLITAAESRVRAGHTTTLDFLHTLADAYRKSGRDDDAKRVDSQIELAGEKGAW